MKAGFSALLAAAGGRDIGDRVSPIVVAFCIFEGLPDAFSDGRCIDVVIEVLDSS